MSLLSIFFRNYYAFIFGYRAAHFWLSNSNFIQALRSLGSDDSLRPPRPSIERSGGGGGCDYSTNDPSPYGTTRGHDPITNYHFWQGPTPPTTLPHVPALQVDQPPPQDPTAIDVPPLPGESLPASSPLEGSPSLLGSTASDHGFKWVSRDRGLRTMPLHDATQKHPDPTPVVIVEIVVQSRRLAFRRWGEG